MCSTKVSRCLKYQVFSIFSQNRLLCPLYRCNVHKPWQLFIHFVELRCLHHFRIPIKLAYFFRDGHTGFYTFFYTKSSNCRYFFLLPVFFLRRCLIIKNSTFDSSSIKELNTKKRGRRCRFCNVNDVENVQYLRLLQYFNNFSILL